jgi:Acetyltransferase (GNAT) domain
VTTIVRDVPEAEWRAFVEGADGDLWYTPEWTWFLEQTFGFPRHHLFATDRSGAVSGLLPLFRVRSRITGDRLSAAPFTHFCGPLGGDEDRAALLAAACRLREDLGAGSLEIHAKVDSGVFQTSSLFSTYILDLSPGPESLRKRFSKNIQRGISQAQRLGVEVIRTRKAEDIAGFYRMNLLHKKDLGVLCHPRRFFDNLFSLFPDRATLYAARYQDETVAGSVILHHRGRYLYGYGAALAESRDLPAQKQILWEGIADACAAGGRSFDFGRVSQENEGLIRFKKSWGAGEKILTTSFYPAPRNRMAGRRDTRFFRVATSVIRAMPVGFFTRLSEAYFGSFG